MTASDAGHVLSNRRREMQMTPRERWTEPKVFGLLEKVFPSGAFTLLPQVRNGTGYTRAVTRTADAIAVSNWPSRGLYLAGVEIKVSFQDWRKELANAQKANEIGQYCRYWYVAAPEGVIPEGEVPENWGVIECTQSNARIIKKATALDEKPIDMTLLAAILRATAAVTVPKSQYDSQLQAGIAAANKRAQDALEHETRSLRDSIARFEEASGVRIQAYREHQIGEAVKMVMEGKHLRIQRDIETIKQASERMLALVAEIQSEVTT